MKMRMMHRVLPALLLALGTTGSAQVQGHHIAVQITGWKNARIWLGNYYGRQTYITDSAELGGTGRAVFSGKQKYPSGIYFVLMPDRHQFFQILLGRHQDFSVEADTSDLAGKVVYQGDPDNDLFSGYNHFLQKIDDRQRQLSIQLNQSRSPADSARVAQQRKVIGQEIYQYRKSFIAAHPSSLLAEIFRAMLDPEPPSVPTLADGRKDSLYAFRYAKDHFFDGVNFSDSALLRTPIYESRLQTYFDHFVTPFPDSINEEADRLLSRARANREMFKFTLWWLTYNYETSRYMGMDAVFVHLVERYYVPGDAYWLTKDQNDKIIQRAYTLAANLIGEKAPELDLLDSSLREHISLYGIEARYTLVVFWDPTCGHCQVEIPEMDSAYRKSWKKMGVKVLAIRTGGTKEQWTDFIRDHGLGDWINAWDPANQTNYRRLYDVYMTPVVYLLDSDKKILAKKLGVRELSDFLDHLSKLRKQGT